MPALKPILHEWIAAQREFTRQKGGEDHSWNHNERASTGFLAVAAWKCGGVSLEEWHTEKGPRNNPRRGRCDLYIYHRKHSFHIEAKHHWSQATGKPERECSYIENKLCKAGSEARTLQCPPREKLGVRQREMEQHLGTWLQGIFDTSFGHRVALPRPQIVKAASDSKRSPRHRLDRSIRLSIGLTVYLEKRRQQLIRPHDKTSAV